MSSALAKQLLKKLPQKALTKTFYYPIVKGIAKFFGVSMTKGIFAKGVSKAVPIIGGFVSGGITFATLRPMGQRLADTLDEAHFSYTESDFEEDWQDIIEVNEEEAADGTDSEESVSKESAKFAANDSMMDEIAKAKQLHDMGIITDEEFSEIKAKLIAKL